MDVGQKLRRIKHNLSSKKDEMEELKTLQSVENRNTKIAMAVGTFRKDVASTIRTGFKEENIDKRKKKLDELQMAANMKDYAVDLEYMQSSCLFKIFNKLATCSQTAAEETVKLELSIERRVYDELQSFLDLEKAQNKSREKIVTALTDYQIAQKALEKEPTPIHQSAADASHSLCESLRDYYTTDVYELSAKENEVAKVLEEYAQMKYEYHERMAAMFKQAIPELQEYRDRAVPSPVFGVDLTYHLRQYQSRIAMPLEKCCTFIRNFGLNEKGLFRINGNHQRMKRIRAALDAGQFDIEQRFYILDPHSVCATMKMYLREMPDPLLTKALNKEWAAAIRLMGEPRLQALEACIDQLPIAHRDNLTYLMRFLNDLTEQAEANSMTPYNIGIVFGPNMMDTDVGTHETNGAKVVETLVRNAQRLFGISESRANSYEFPRRGSNESTPQLSRSHGNPISPRVTRPKERAPPPPGTEGSSRQAEEKSLIDMSDIAALPEVNEHELSDEWSDGFSSGTPSQSNSLSRSYTERRPHRPPPPSYRNLGEHSQNRPISYHIAVGSSTPVPKVEEPVVRQSTVQLMMSTPTAPERKRQSVIGLMSSNSSTRSQNSSNSQKSVEIGKVTTVTDGGDNRTLVSVDDDPTPSNANAMPKPPLPVKPKDLVGKESSRL